MEEVRAQRGASWVNCHTRTEQSRRDSNRLAIKDFARVRCRRRLDHWIAAVAEYLSLRQIRAGIDASEGFESSGVVSSEEAKVRNSRFERGSPQEAQAPRSARVV